MRSALPLVKNGRMTEEGIEIIWKNIGQDTRCEDGIAGKLQIKRTRIGGCENASLCSNCHGRDERCRIAMIVIQDADDVGTGRRPPRRLTEEVKFAGILVKRVAVGTEDLRTAIVLAELDVDHARDRIRAVDAGRAVLKDFDALDGSPRDGIEINESRRASFTRALGIGSEAPSIEQNQRAADGETAQGDGRSATGVRRRNRC